MCGMEAERHKRVWQRQDRHKKRNSFNQKMCVFVEQGYLRDKEGPECFSVRDQHFVDSLVVTVFV